jgi:hypothetical protein
MRDGVKGRGALVARHDFDLLPDTADVEVRCAKYGELPQLAEMAHRLIPGIELSEAGLARYFTFDPECILTFGRHDNLLGGIAFLYLNERGHDALLLDDICLTAPEIEYLAVPDEEVSATYIWACALTGRGISGFGKVAAHLRKPRYVNADVFAQPSTKAGRDWLAAMDFRETQSFQPDLWTYERSWNRLPIPVSVSGISTRSYADGRR